MKKIAFLTSILFLSTFNLLAQENLSFSKVIQTDSVGKNIIYSTIYDWFASTYNSANEVIQMQDKEAGIIIGNGSFSYFRKMPYECYRGNIKYKIKVTIKDNKYKVELTDFKHIANGIHCNLGFITSSDVYTDSGMSKNAHNKTWVDLKLKIEEYSNSIFVSLETKTKTMSVSPASDF